ncbi:hypothetical protein EVAR_75329_1 [Eumeta japonica]|uniref:Uncharacterized protein n=1 Tax=Eumeta variegata TaxID=151549 RepID=A0A4C1Y2V5_EUMVA|nr:hypothetical protein EVAR_75329_1 [Eumeta japonica]
MERYLAVDPNFVLSCDNGPERFQCKVAYAAGVPFGKWPKCRESSRYRGRAPAPAAPEYPPPDELSYNPLSYIIEILLWLPTMSLFG